MRKRTSISLDEKIHKKAVSLAKKEGRSLSNYISFLIEGEWEAIEFEKRQKKNKEV